MAGDNGKWPVRIKPNRLSLMHPAARYQGFSFGGPIRMKSRGAAATHENRGLRRENWFRERLP